MARSLGAVLMPLWCECCRWCEAGAEWQESEFDELHLFPFRFPYQFLSVIYSFLAPIEYPSGCELLVGLRWGCLECMYWAFSIIRIQNSKYCIEISPSSGFKTVSIVLLVSFVCNGPILLNKNNSGSSRDQRSCALSFVLLFLCVSIPKIYDCIFRVLLVMIMTVF